MVAAPMKIFVESSRAAAMAAHSAASLMHGSSKSMGVLRPRLMEAARLMRSAESLARLATALLQDEGPPSAHAPAAGAPAQAAQPRSRRARRRGKKKKKEKENSPALAMEVEQEPSEHAAAAFSRMARSTLTR